MQTPQLGGDHHRNSAKSTSNAEVSDQIQSATDFHRELRLISDCVPGPIARFDRECRYLFVNKYSEEYLGMKESDIVGRKLADVIGLEAYQRAAPYFNRALAGEQVEYERYSPNANGEHRYMLIRLTPERDSNGNVVGFVFVAFDITDRKQAEEAREEASRRISKFASRLPGAIYQYRLRPDKTSCIPYASEKMETILGVQKEYLNTSEFRAFTKLHVEDFDLVLSSIVKSAETLLPWSKEFRLIEDDGQTRWISCDSVPEREPDGSTLWHGYAVDITERKHVELELQKITDNLEMAQSLAKIGSWTYQAKTGKTVWSKQLYKLFGRDEQLGPAGTPEVYDLFHPDDVGRLQASFEKTIELGIPYSLVCRSSNSETQTAYLRCDGRARRDDNGEIVEINGTVMDVTDSIKREEQLMSAHRKAEAANIAKSEFLANMSHEIRTPLTSILGFTDVLIDDNKNPDPSVDRLNVLETISHAGKHLLSVINDILDLTKVEAEMVVLRPTETLLVHLLQDLHDLVRHMAQTKGLKLNFALHGDIPEQVYCDQTRLRQILLNLIGNAIKFTDKGSVTVTVSMDVKDRKRVLVVDVEDTGCGISAEQAKLLFKPFTQVDSSVKREFGGTGLGLAISKRMANLMQGDVSIVRSELNKGSTFRIALPMESVPGSKIVQHFLQDPPPKPTQASEPVFPLRLDGRILLVEDGIDNQKLIAFHLRKTGAHVTVADNGKIALDLVERSFEMGELFDLVLTDIQMPVMDGLELTRNLRERGCDLPIIAITAHALAEDKQRCFDAGCDDFESKPIVKAKLLETCQRWLNLSKRI